MPPIKTMRRDGASQVMPAVKQQPASAGDPRDVGLTPGSGRSPRAGSGNPPQYSFLENSMDRAAWWATVPGAAKSQTQLSTHAILKLGCYRKCDIRIICYTDQLKEESHIRVSMTV